MTAAGNDDTLNPVRMSPRGFLTQRVTGVNVVVAMIGVIIIAVAIGVYNVSLLWAAGGWIAFVIVVLPMLCAVLRATVILTCVTVVVVWKSLRSDLVMWLQIYILGWLVMLGINWVTHDTGATTRVLFDSAGEIAGTEAVPGVPAFSSPAFWELQWKGFTPILTIIVGLAWLLMTGMNIILEIVFASIARVFHRD
ncbi:MAG: hypothetical protein QOD99_2399 [Chthoniobacter sp.]|jgi:hypothetical protein|nr:hypothetical protein [Chthoniobacter sp.]